MGRSLYDDLVSDSARVLGENGEFAVTVMYTHPRGVDAQPVVGIWRVIGHAEVMTTRGKEMVAAAELQTTSDVILEEGYISVNSESWSVKRVGRSMYGQRTIYCHGTTILHRANGNGNKP